MALRAIRGLKELRFILCQTSIQSEGVRNYIANNYQFFKQSPAKIIVRQCEYIQPYIIATYRFGMQKRLSIANLKAEEINQAISHLDSLSQKLSSQMRN